MLNAIHGVMLYAHTYTSSEALSQCYSRGKALCSLLYLD